MGEVRRHDDVFQVRNPGNWGFYHGNYLLLDRPPTVDDLDGWIGRFTELFREDPVNHVCLWWDTAEMDEGTCAHAVGRGFVLDHGLSMVLTDAPPAGQGATVRPLDPISDWEALQILNRACDPTETPDDPTYTRFKEGLRAGWRSMMRGGHATWDGAFRGDELVGQCGLVPFERWGRLQSVETHPDHRRQGVCSELVAHVASVHLDDLPGGLLLSADPEGPALGLYERLGFTSFERRQSMVLGGRSLHVRREAPGDAATVRTVLTAAFGQPQEAAIVDALRDRPGVLAFVADQSGTVLGHIAFSPVTITSAEGTWHSIALGPMAVRPSHQSTGVGTELVEHGLRMCREAGHALCFVLGHPGYYPRFGFRPAAPHGFTLADWTVPDDVFMVAELQAGALGGRTGEVRYSGAFHLA